MLICSLTTQLKGIVMKTSLPVCLLFCFLLISLGGAQDTINITSDDACRSWPAEVAGWETLGFDDSSWNSPITTPCGGCACSINDILPNSNASFVWDSANLQFAFIRKTFSLSELPASATIKIFADDDYDLYINGVFVGADHDCWCEGPDSYDVATHLREGQNLIAVKADDCFGGCRWLVFDLERSPPSDSQLQVFNHETGLWVSTPNPAELFNSNFPTTVIVHGWNPDCYTNLNQLGWTLEIAEKIHLRETTDTTGVNILGWEWLKEAKNNDNTCRGNLLQVPSHEISNQKELLSNELNSLFSNTSYSSGKKLLLMGHSLGAHIVAWCGSKLITPEFGSHRDLHVVMWDPPTDEEAIFSLRFIADIREPINTIRSITDKNPDISAYTELYDGLFNVGKHNVHLWVDVPGRNHDVYNWYKDTIWPISNPELIDSTGNVIAGKTIGYGTTAVSARPSPVICHSQCTLDTVVVNYLESDSKFQVEKNCAPCAPFEPFVPQTTPPYLIDGEEFYGSGSGVIDGSSFSFWLERMRKNKLQDVLTVTCKIPVVISEDWDYLSFNYAFWESSHPASISLDIETNEEVYTSFLSNSTGSTAQNSSGYLQVGSLHGQAINLIFQLSSENQNAGADINNLSFFQNTDHKNQPPSANAGQDAEYETTPQGDRLVTLSGSGADPEQGPLWFTWLENENFIGSGEQVEILLLPGQYTFTLEVSDQFGAIAQDEVAITIRAQTIPFIRSDPNRDLCTDIGDAVNILAYLFLDGQQICEDAADANDNGWLDLADAIYILEYVFLNGPVFPDPFPNSGLDPTPDNLSCDL